MNPSLYGGRRYQVFLSSTYDDLRRERQMIIQSLLQINCFPIAMEHFPASYDKQWTYIKPLIEKSDFFICLVAGRYGNRGDDGISFTERELRFALDCKIPTIIFYHDKPESLASELTESTDEGKQKLAEFRNFVLKDRLCKAWITSDQLPSLVIPALIEMALTSDRPGWEYRGEKSKEFLELQLTNSSLQNRIKELETSSLSGPLASFLDYDDSAPTIVKAIHSSATSCERAGEKLKIRLMGICLHKSFPTLRRFVETMTARDLRIEVRLAILDETSEAYKSLNHRWRSLYDIFQEDLSHFLQQLRTKMLTRNISIKLVRYKHMPNWHGILINYDHLFMGHCLWHEDGSLVAAQEPYDYYRKEHSAVHARKIQQYTAWFDYCRRSDASSKESQLLIETALQS